MYRLKFFVVLNCLLIQSLVFSQEYDLPFDLQISGIVPQWVYITKDSNYVDTPFSPPSASIYSNRFTSWVDLSDDQVLIFEQNAGPLNGFSGYSLFGLNKETGEQAFVFHDNSHAGLMYSELYTSAFHEIEEDTLRIFGYRGAEPQPNNYIVVHHGSPIIKKVDLIEKELLEEKVGIPETEAAFHTIFTPANGKQFINKSREHIHYLSHGEIIDSKAFNAMSFYKITEELTIDSNSKQQILFDTNINTVEPTLTTNPIFEILNDSTLFLINSVKAVPDFSQSPSFASVSWWDVSSIDQIEKISEYEITDDFIKQENPYLFLLANNFNKDVILTQYVDSPDPESNLEVYSWLSWYHQDEGFVARLDKFGDAEKRYSFLTPLRLQNNELLFCAYYDTENGASYDVFSLFRGQSEAKQIGSIDFKNKVGLSFNPSLRVYDLEKGLSLFYVRYKMLKENGSYTNVLLYMAFDFDTLLSNDNSSINLSESISFELMPNPSTDRMVAVFDKMANGVVEIRDLQGVKLHSQKLSSTFQVGIDVDHLMAGTYILKYTNELGLLYSKFFQKM